MELYEAIHARQCIRSYGDGRIPDGVVERLLEAAVAAPSAGNLQSWRFYVVAEPRLKEGLARAARQRFVGQASHVIVVCADLVTAENGYGDRGRELYCFQDAAAATQNLFLAATAEGLAACWVGAFDEAAVSRLLDLPARFRPVALVPLGYPGGTTGRRPRKPLSEVAEWR
ncbi:MAG: nitroreductase family protein [Actinobacteria bacterium]|nr:nitroreductase family protein [Actinomycetota bacterium]